MKHIIRQNTENGAYPTLMDFNLIGLIELIELGENTMLVFDDGERIMCKENINDIKSFLINNNIIIR